MEKIYYHLYTENFSFLLYPWHCWLNSHPGGGLFQINRAKTFSICPHQSPSQFYSAIRPRAQTHLNVFENPSKLDKLDLEC